MAEGPNDIWTHLLASAAAEKKAKAELDQAASDTLEATAIFVGGKQAGKSSIITKFLDPNAKKEHKPTAALEYQFGRKTSETGRRIVHLWELGGGIHLAEMLKVVLKKDN